MSNHLTISLIDPAIIHQALDRIRQAEPLGNNPLKRLVWLRQRLDQRGVAASTVVLDLEAGEALFVLIAQNCARLRQVVGAPAEEPADRPSALDLLRADFSRNNTELEAWSALYFRYARPDLDLRAQEMAQTVGVDPRQLRRRFDHGYQRLAEAISRLEGEARAANRRLWMRLKLPPAPYSTLVGVEDRLSQAYELIAAEPPHVLALVGPGGCGKTALAHALCARLIAGDRLADLAWIDLDRASPYPALLALLSEQVGLTQMAQDTPVELEASLRTRFFSTPTLVVLDNADWLADPDDSITRLARLLGQGRLLVVTRQHLSTGVPASSLLVEPLDRSAMDRLLLDFVRLHRVAPARRLDAQALSAIFEAVGGNPLAGRLVVGQLAYLPLDRVLANLGSVPAGRGESLYAHLFERAWESMGIEAQRAALAMLLLPREGADWDALQAACGLKSDTLNQAIEALMARSLLESEGEEPVYMLPPLTRRFVEEQSRQPRWEATFKELLETADSRLGDGSEAAYAADLAHTLLVLHHESQRGVLPADLDQRLAQVAPSARRSGQWLAWRDLLRYLVERLEPGGGNRPALARALVELGVAYRWLGEADIALLTLDQAVALYGDLGDFLGQAAALVEVGILHQLAARRAAAYESFQRAAAAAERFHASDVRARALNHLAGLLLEDSQPRQALELLQAASAGMESPDGQTLSNLSMAYLQLGAVSEAVACQQGALALFEEEADLPRQARAHLRLGMAYHAAHQPDRAVEALSQGLGLMRALGDALGQARALNNLGAVYSDNRRYDDALDVWNDALALQSQLGDRVGMAYTYFNLADLQHKVNRPDAARGSLAAAAVIARELGLTALLAHIASHPLNVA